MKQVWKVRPQSVIMLGKPKKTEMKKRLQEIPTSTGNAATVEKEVTGLMIFGLRNKKRKTMTLTTYSWDPNSVKNSKKITMKKILKNG